MRLRTGIPLIGAGLLLCLAACHGPRDTDAQLAASYTGLVDSIRTAETSTDVQPLPEVAPAAADTTALPGEDAPEAEAASYTVVPEAVTTEGIRFVDVAREAGITFRHVTGAFGQKWMPETVGSGCAVFDYDGDGHLDLLFVNSTAWPGRSERKGTLHLYRNQGDGTFQDVTQAAGLARSLYGMGVTVGDYDADGDPDLYLTAVGPNLLLRNDGGRFVDQTQPAGVDGGQWQGEDGQTHPAWSTAAAWVDVDRDGWIDLFVANYVQWSPETDLFTTMDGTNKSYATPKPYPGSSCRLYRNLGNGRFEDVTEQAGLYNTEAKALGVAVADLEGDGWMDLLVTNDTQPNFLFHNKGDGTFEETALMAGIAYDEMGRARAGMGIDVASLGQEGLLTIAIGNFSRESLSFYRQAARQSSTFLDMAGKYRIAQPTLLNLTFGLLFFDVDLDGRQDLVLANGHIEPEISTVQKEIAYAQPLQLLWNTGRDAFEDVSAKAGPAFQRTVVGRGLAAGDLDADGDLDLVVSANGGAPLVLRNESATGQSLTLHLRGHAPNRDALGATVVLRAGGQTQQRLVRTGSSYLSHSDLALLFGTGAAAQADEVRIRWPDGEEEVLTNLPTGARYWVEQGRGVTRTAAYAAPT